MSPKVWDFYFSFYTGSGDLNFVFDASQHSRITFTKWTSNISFQILEKSSLSNSYETNYSVSTLFSEVETLALERDAAPVQSGTHQ